MIASLSVWLQLLVFDYKVQHQIHNTNFSSPNTKPGTTMAKQLTHRYSTCPVPPNHFFLVNVIHPVQFHNIEHHSNSHSCSQRHLANVSAVNLLQLKTSSQCRLVLPVTKSSTRYRYSYFYRCSRSLHCTSNPIDISRLVSSSSCNTTCSANASVSDPVPDRVVATPWLSAISIALLLSLFSGKNSKFETQVLPQTRPSFCDHNSINFAPLVHTHSIPDPVQYLCTSALSAISIAILVRIKPHSFKSFSGLRAHRLCRYQDSHTL